MNLRSAREHFQQKSARELNDGNNPIPLKRGSLLGSLGRCDQSGSLLSDSMSVSGFHVFKEVKNSVNIISYNQTKLENMFFIAKYIAIFLKSLSTMCKLQVCNIDPVFERHVGTGVGMFFSTTLNVMEIYLACHKINGTIATCLLKALKLINF